MSNVNEGMLIRSGKINTKKFNDTIAKETDMFKFHGIYKVAIQNICFIYSFETFIYAARSNSDT